MIFCVVVVLLFCVYKFFSLRQSLVENNSPKAPRELRRALSWPGSARKKKELDLSSKDLKEFRDSWRIEKLSNLQLLRLSDNHISFLPQTLFSLITLTELDLQQNKLRSLPESIGDLKNLTDLNIERNQILRLPKSIGKLSNLVSLSAGSNRLVYIPEEIGQLNLTGLWLDNNCLTTIPKSIGYINTLTELCVQDNLLKSLPSSLEKLSSLTVFYCYNNKLTALPSLVSMRKLTVRGLRVDGNQLEARGTLPAFLTLHPDLHDLPVDASESYGTPDPFEEPKTNSLYDTPDPFEEPPSGSTFIGEAEFRYLNHCEDEFPENIKSQRYFHEVMSRT